jgi:hypothetical protein
MTLIIEGNRYRGSHEIPHKTTLRNFSVYTSSLPTRTRDQSMDCYFPTLRTVEGHRGYVINSHINVKADGLELIWIPKNLGLTAPLIRVSASFLHDHRLDAIMKQGEEDIFVQMFFPKPPHQSGQTKPWSI